jgi:predicted anti-sigma-YlaC factor YlaD
MMSAQSQNGRAAENVHLNEEMMQKYQTHRLAVEELRAADRHLSSCGTCRRILLARMGPLRLPEELAEVVEPLHLSYEQITAYIDGALTGADKELVEAHTFLCASCSREIADLRRLDQQLAAPAATETKAVVPSVSITGWVRQFFAAPGRVREFGLAFGAIVAGFFLLFQAGQGGGEGGGSAARIMHLGAPGHAGLNLGGFLLLTAGVGYIAYSLWKKR